MNKGKLIKKGHEKSPEVVEQRELSAAQLERNLQRWVRERNRQSEERRTEAKAEFQKLFKGGK